MFVYNQQVFKFIETCQVLLKEILQEEVKIPFKRTRFLYCGYYYPIKFVVFEGKSTLAYFDADTYELALNEGLMRVSKKVLANVIRHEFAHFLNHIENPGHSHPHGAEFKSICARLGWNHEVSQASLDLSQVEVSTSEDYKRVLERVKKLLRLADSDNLHEAQLATIKANKLILKYNIEHLHSETNFYLKRIYETKKRNAKLILFYDILQNFNLSPLLRYKKKGVYLEVCSTRMNIELAEYVVEFLDKKVDQFWLEHKKEHGLKGLAAKNSFFHGVAKGYNQKFDHSLDPEDRSALTTIRASYNKQLKRIYARISYASSAAQTKATSFNLGVKAGLKLTINRGIKSTSKTLGITYEA